MDTKILEAIRQDMDITQAAMADLLLCDPVGYRRYETGARPIPPYIQRGVELVHFLHKNGLLNKFQKFIEKDLTL